MISIRAILPFLFRRLEMKIEMTEELRSHIQHRADDLERSGLSRAEAEHQAQIEFGGFERLREECYEASGKHFLESLFQDTSYGLRMLRKSPGFTTVAVLTLALGIGANTAIFSVVNAVLLRPLPFPHAEELVAFTEANPQEGNIETGTSYINFEAWRKQNKSFRDIAGYQSHDLTLTGFGNPSSVDTVVATPSLFPLLGVKPLVGRLFSEDEGKEGAAPVVLLSEKLWRNRFGGDEKMIGKSITLDKRAFTVVGIMPESFRYPVSMPKEDVWIPLVQDPLFGSWMSRPGGHWLRVIGRLRSGVSQDQARTEMDTIAARLAKEDPAQNQGWRIHITPLHQMVVGRVKSPLLILLCAVGFLLLIACVNIANLLLARSASRSKEISVRIALGADRRRIARQLLTESLLLGLFGSLLGMALAYAGVSGLTSLLPPGLPQIQLIRVDGFVLGFAVVLFLVASLGFGLAPVLFATGAIPQTNLRESARTGEARNSQRARNILAISEVALAAVLLVAAGLLIHSFARLTALKPGFDARHVVKADISLPRFQYATPQQWNTFSNELLTRLQAEPGMKNSAIAVPLPVANSPVNIGFTIVGDPPLPPGRSLLVDYVAASPNYFSVMGIPLISGRLFQENDSPTTPTVALISQTLARRYFHDRNPIGRQIVVGFPPNGAMAREIVGVVGDVRDVSLSQDPGPMIYVPFAQAPFWGGEVVVKSTLDLSAVAGSLRQVTYKIDKDLPVEEIAPLSNALDASVAEPRFRTLLLGSFSAIALLLAAVGIFGVVSFSVSRRTQEIGVRVALGATPENVRRLVIGESAALVFFGLAIGIPVALILTRFLSTVLFAVHPADPVTLIGVSLLLVAVAIAAAYVPARRAMSVEPIVALRYE